MVLKIVLHLKKKNVDDSGRKLEYVWNFSMDEAEVLLWALLLNYWSVFGRNESGNEATFENKTLGLRIIILQ